MSKCFPGIPKCFLCVNACLTVICAVVFAHACKQCSEELSNILKVHSNQGRQQRRNQQDLHLTDFYQGSTASFGELYHLWHAQNAQGEVKFP